MFWECFIISVILFIIYWCHTSTSQLSFTIFFLFFHRTWFSHHVPQRRIKNWTWIIPQRFLVHRSTWGVEGGLKGGAKPCHPLGNFIFVLLVNAIKRERWDPQPKVLYSPPHVFSTLVHLCPRPRIFHIHSQTIYAMPSSKNWFGFFFRIQKHLNVIYFQIWEGIFAFRFWFMVKWFFLPTKLMLTSPENRKETLTFWGKLKWNRFRVLFILLNLKTI